MSSEELSPARKFKLKVQGSEGSQHVGAAVSASAGPRLHTPAASLTNNSKQLLFLRQSGPDMVETVENDTGKGNTGLVSSPSWLRTKRVDV